MNDFLFGMITNVSMKTVATVTAISREEDEDGD